MTEKPAGSDELILRPMRPIDVPGGWALSVALGWPHRLEDWAQMYRLGVGAVIENGRSEIVGTVFTTFQGDYATIGLAIVRGGLQGRGLGSRLMRWALEAAGNRSVVLNATAEGLKLYRKLGFQTVGSVCQHQRASLSPPTHRVARPLRPARHGDMARLAELAGAATGFDRSRVLTEVCTLARRILVTDDGPLFQTFGILRPFGRGYQIGPVVAGNTEQAIDIVAALLAETAGEFVRIDCPADCGLEPMIQVSGLKPVASATMMVRGNVRVPTEIRQFALTTQALG